MQIPQHITDLSRTDFEEIAAVANMRQGPGIILERQGDALTIKIDETWLQSYVARYIAFNQA